MHSIALRSPIEITKSPVTESLRLPAEQLSMFLHHALVPYHCDPKLSGVVDCLFVLDALLHPDDSDALGNGVSDNRQYSKASDGLKTSTMSMCSEMSESLE